MGSLPACDAASLILIDLDNLLDEGEALVQELSSQPGCAPIVAISSSLSEDAIDRALNAGAVAYLPKSYTRPLVECVLRLALHGEGYRPARNSRQTGTAPESLSAESEADFAPGLTARETDVLGEIAQGCSNFEIARRLHMSEATVKTHTHKIFRKLNVQNRAEAALRAARMREIQKLQIDEAERGKLNLSWLQPEMTHRHMLRDQWIFRSGDVGSELFYLQRGRVYLPEIDVTLGPGDVFGEVGLFTAERKRTCSARCATDVDLLSLSREKARRIYFANPQFALFILTLVATRLMAERIRAGAPLP
jgi:DNA-binding NarL/FixJ family response regulator